MNSVLPVDIESAIQDGLGSWHENPSWPVSESEFFKLNRWLDDAFDRAHAALDETWRDLLLADWGFIVFLAQYVHAKAVQARVVRRGGTLLPGSVARPFYAPNWNDVGSFHRSRLEAKRPPFSRLRRIRRRVIYNGHLPLSRMLANSVLPISTWSIGAWSSLKTEYLRRHGLACDFPFLESITSGAQSGVACTEQTREILADFLSGLAEYCRHSLEFDLDVEDIPLAWVERLRSLHHFYFSFQQSRRLPKLILIGSAGDPLNRTLALAARRNGTKTVAFQHGHNMGYTYEPARSYIDVSISDEFACSTPAATESLGELARSVRFTGDSETSFVSLGDQTYEDLWNRHAGKSWPDRVRSVMVLGYPMNAMRYVYGTGLFWNFKLDIELRIIHTLRQAGIEVLYRPHPDTEPLMTKVMATEGAKILQEPFESVYRRADALLFTYPLTTTFGFALCSEKPIVLLDMEGEPWYEDIYRLIRKRCATVPVRFDERNRIDFAGKDLLRAIDEALEKRNYEYVFSYLFPSQRKVAPPQ